MTKYSFMWDQDCWVEGPFYCIAAWGDDVIYHWVVLSRPYWCLGKDPSQRYVSPPPNLHYCLPIWDLQGRFYHFSICWQLALN